MWPNPQFPADLVTFTEEIFNGKLHFLCRVSCRPLAFNLIKERTLLRSCLSAFFNLTSFSFAGYHRKNVIIVFKSNIFNDTKFFVTLKNKIFKLFTLKKIQDLHATDLSNIHLN